MQRSSSYTDRAATPMPDAISSLAYARDQEPFADLVVTDDASTPAEPAARAHDRGRPFVVMTGDVKRTPNQPLRLLAEESPEEYERLLPLLEPLTLNVGFLLYEPGGPIPAVYFPEGCVTSVVKILLDGRRIEVGTTGFEGMAGLPAFLGAESAPLQCFIQVPGPALRLSTESLREAAATGSALHGILQRYAQYLFNRAAQSLACNRLHHVYSRCARWLLMTHDRVGHDRFELKHQFLALMLGVRRASVSQATEAMQDAGLIRYRRAKITILDRAGLERAACECYHTGRADFERLLTQVLPPTVFALADESQPSSLPDR